MHKTWFDYKYCSLCETPSITSYIISDVTPSAVHVGNIVQGVRLAWAQGRDIGLQDDESDAAKKVSIHLLYIIRGRPMLDNSLFCICTIYSVSIQYIIQIQNCCVFNIL